jgi:hypothetical protein
MRAFHSVQHSSRGLLKVFQSQRGSPFGLLSTNLFQPKDIPDFVMEKFRLQGAFLGAID